MASTSVEIVDTLDPLGAEWMQLADRAQAPPFLYPEWFRAWRSAFGRGALEVLAARREGRLVGVVPMEVYHGAWRSPTNAHSPGFDVLATDEEAATVIASAVFAGGGREIAVGGLDAEGRALRVLADAARRCGYRVIVQPTGRAPYLPLHGSLPRHERALSRNLRHDVHRRLRRLCETGIVSVQLSEGATDLDELLAEGFGVEARSWKGRRGTAIAAHDDTARFYTELARSAADAGWLRLAFLRLDGRAIAFQFDLELGSRYFSLKIGYDPAFERFSPGKLLTYMMVARAVARGLRAYELLGTDEPWKERWTKLSRDQVAFRAFAPSGAGRFSASVYVRGKQVAHRMPLIARVAAALRR